EVACPWGMWPPCSSARYCTTRWSSSRPWRRRTPTRMSKRRVARLTHGSCRRLATAVLAPCHPDAKRKDLGDVLRSAQDDRKGPARRHPAASDEIGVTHKTVLPVG